MKRRCNWKLKISGSNDVSLEIENFEVFLGLHVGRGNK